MGKLGKPVIGCLGAGALGFSALVLYTTGASADLAYLSAQTSWTSFQQHRVVAHIDYLTGLMALIPPIGVLGAVHHGGRVLDASIDKDQPSSFTMAYLRNLVLDSDDCADKIIAFEGSLPKGQPSKSGSITCEVFFGAGISDSFQMKVMSSRTEDGVKTSFFVNGLGFVPCTADQSPTHLVRNAGPLKTVLSKPLLAGDDLVAKLIEYDLAVPVWMNLTESTETSFFSDGSSRMSVSNWKQKTMALHQDGGGYSASELFPSSAVVGTRNRPEPL